MARNGCPDSRKPDLAGDRQRLELLLTTMIRSLRRDSPDLSDKLGTLLAPVFGESQRAPRWVESGPPPTDTEEGLALVQVLPTDDAPMPIFASDPMDRGQPSVPPRARKECVPPVFEEASLHLPPYSSSGPLAQVSPMLATWLAHRVWDCLFWCRILASSIFQLLRQARRV